MDAEEILAKTTLNGALPDGWIVFPLLKGKVFWGLIGWVLGVLMGLGLLALIVPIVVPSNYQHGIAPIILTTILLGILLFIFIGSLCMLITDIQRLLKSDQHVIVLTNTDFVKREGSKIIQVPLTEIRHITPRGRAPIDRTAPEGAALRTVPRMGESMFGLVFGRGTTEEGQRHRRKRMRTPTSLAFMDGRTESEVTVVNDDVYGDPFTLANVIEQYIISAKAAESVHLKAETSSTAGEIANK
jgi:hypothetical protein